MTYALQVCICIPSISRMVCLRVSVSVEKNHAPSTEVASVCIFSTLVPLLAILAIFYRALSFVCQYRFLKTRWVAVFRHLNKHGGKLTDMTTRLVQRSVHAPGPDGD